MEGLMCGDTFKLIIDTNCLIFTFTERDLQKNDMSNSFESESVSGTKRRKNGRDWLVALRYKLNQPKEGGECEASNQSVECFQVVNEIHPEEKLSTDI